MSQDSIEIIAEIAGSGSITPKKSTIKRKENSPTTSTPSKFDNQGSPSKGSPKLSLSQDISRRPNKFIASPTKSPSKKASPGLTKYSPFKKNSPSSKPITSYFKRTPEKSSANPLSQVLQSVKQNDEPVTPDKELFESLLSDDFDLSQVETDADALTPAKELTVDNRPVKSTSNATEPNILSPDEPKENLPNEANSVAEEYDDIFKAKKIKKKVKKALFPSVKSSNKSKNAPGRIPLDSSSLLDSQPEDPVGASENDASQNRNYLATTSLSVDFKVSKGSTPQIKGLSPVVNSGDASSSPHSQSDESYVHADSYSSCIEAALTDCLHYLKANKERGIFVDINELEKFTSNGSLHQTRRRLYARLLINRQYKWYRVKDLSSYEAALKLSHEELVAELIRLEEEGFLTSDLDQINLVSMLTLLPVKDLKQLCKFIRVSDNKTKPELIKQLVNHEQKQPMLGFFPQTSQSRNSKPSILVKRTKELLGHCIKLTEGPRNVFFQCLLFATYPFFSGDPQTRLKDYLDRIVKVQNNEISFPPYTVQRTVIFSFERLFKMYQEALDINENVFTALNSDKKNIDWTKIAEYAELLIKKFEETLQDDEVIRYMETLPTFLHRFTAGHIHARTLFSIIRENKKSHDKNFVVKALNLLLSQKLYASSKRGAFYEELAMTHQNHMKDNEKALEIVLQGLKDPQIDLPTKHTLCVRGTMLIRRKTNPVSQELKAEVENYLIHIPNPNSVTINARCLDCKSGYKQIYVTETDDGVEFSSVEEVAKSYYRKLGFTQVLHDEGGTIRALIFACFWDIIYTQPRTLTEHSVFHSPFQSHPLDWGSHDFFQNRQPEILARLHELEEGGVDSVILLFSNVCQEFENVESVVNWNYLSKTRLNLLKDFVTALSVKVFCKLSLHLLQNVRLYGKAFPDLTMWNPLQEKCMFVEVKSPNDRLSNDQKLWLNNLSKMGANAEVCHIQATGSRKRKLVGEASTSSSI